MTDVSLRLPKSHQTTWVVLSLHPLSSFCHSQFAVGVLLLAFIFIALLPEHTVKLHSSLLLPQKPNLASCSGLDAPVAQWNKPVCLLYKPMFQAYTLWRLHTALLKEKKREREKERKGGKMGESNFSCDVDIEMGLKNPKKKRNRRSYWPC